MKICIVTGGTGGHIYPALSFAKAIQDQIKDAEILFIGNQDRMESTEIPAYGYAFKGLPTQAVTGSFFKRALSYIRLFQNGPLADRILQSFRPDWVIGFGGYVSVPVILAAKRRGIPTFLHEQNAIAGKANRFLSHFATGIAVSYPKNLKQFPQHKTRLVGNPRTYEIAHRPAGSVLQSLNLDPKSPTVLFVMGSLGAESIHAISSLVLERLNAAKIQTIFVTGKKHYDAFIEATDETATLKIVPYINQIDAMREVTLMVTRGGATTAAEIMVIGVPSIIVPSPYVPNNHQYYNAKELSDAQGCLLLEEKDLDANGLYEAILSILNQPQVQSDMKAKALSLAHPRAAQDLLAWILERLPA